MSKRVTGFEILAHIALIIVINATMINADIKTSHPMFYIFVLVLLAMRLFFSLISFITKKDSTNKVLRKTIDILSYTGMTGCVAYFIFIKITM